MKKNSSIGFLKIAIVTFIITFLLTAGVYAAWEQFNRGIGYGYFYNHNEGGSNDSSSNVLPPIDPTGMALPTSGPQAINSVTSLINLLKDYNTNGDAREKAGSAFIVNTMLNRDAPGSGKIISSKDWTDLSTRLNAREAVGKINWNTTKWSCDTNSYYQRTNHDDAFYVRSSGCLDEPAIKILADDSSVLYTLDRMCANPVGDVGSIPIPKPWSVTVTSSANVSSVLPGKAITWTHSVRNAGTYSTDKPVDYNWRRSGVFSGEGGNGTIPSGFASNKTTKFTSTYVVPAGTTPGTTFCSATVASPSSNTVSAEVVSTPACVTVGNVPVSHGGCRPIEVIVGESIRDYQDKIVPVLVKAKSNASSSIGLGSYEASTTIDITTECTTGDVWSIEESTLPYVYAIEPYECGSEKKPRTCDRKLYTTYTKSQSVGPCYDYILNTSINNFGARQEVGTNINITPTVKSESYTQVNFASFYNMYKTHTHSKQTDWQITMMTVEPNIDVPESNDGGASADDPCDYYDPRSVSKTCTVMKEGDTVFNTSGSPSSSLGQTYVIPDVPAGTKFCFAFSIKPSQSDPMNYTSSWNSSEPWNHAEYDPVKNCVTVVKKPKVQIWGGDLSVGGYTKTSTSSKLNVVTGANDKFGSWVEYAIYARGNIFGTASASAFAIPGARPNAADYSKLSFTNSCNGGYGCYDSSRSIPDVAASFPDGTKITDTTIMPNNLTGGIYAIDGDVLIKTSTLDKGRTIIIKAAGTVTIIGNQLYHDGPYNSISELPQLVIIAKKILIQSNVTRVDAWLVAHNANKDGAIVTCEVEGKDINKCDQRLIVNGPVMTDHLYLYRTAGSDPGDESNDPAEIFNLRADAYLWGAAYSLNKGAIQTVRVTDVPPRN
jgi:hypothetical protein